MTGYRFLSVAEEEMSEAALFYEAASPGLAKSFSLTYRMLLHRFPFSLIYSV